MKSFGPIKLNWSDGQTGSFLWWPAIPGGAGAQTSGTWKSKKYCNSSIGGLSGKQNLSKQHIEVISHDMLTSSSGYLKSVFDVANECIITVWTKKVFESISYMSSIAQLHEQGAFFLVYHQQERQLRERSCLWHLVLRQQFLSNHWNFEQDHNHLSFWILRSYPVKDKATLF